jgi:hypothetical protein
MKYPNLLTAVLVLASMLHAQPSQSLPRTLTQDEAEKLAFMALSPQVKKLPGIMIDRDSVTPEFYYFTALWANPDGSAVAGHFAVRKTTGDVWSSVVCEESKSRELRKLQKSMRGLIGLGEKEYRKLRRPGPMC